MIIENLIGTFQIQTTKKNVIGETDHEMNAKIQESTHIFLCYWFDCDALGITSENARIIIDGQIYDIKIIDDPMHLHQHLEIYLKYVGGQSATQ